ncbi:Proteophosphoglycan ppg4 [Rhodotorula toruloides ATCC 204091]|uniref:Proteophosphoglycan ppg4 n=1 Tax=Rhodotorula toruloides TaxID=5286 RepID=A0A0K3CF56_RHOTO|nr:Proteophosphoglycan ppg4 [Rhodotorula toruloides ATCC 204091]PRQ74549.1 Proteophosphoglycan ppg4 [Rhodotorula toruloides]
MSSSCLSCSDSISPCPVCPGGQVCIQTGRSCTVCPKNICVDDGSKGNSGSGGPSAGATAGGAVGGVLGVAAILAAVYFFWWRPRGLAASRKRYSQHLAKRQSKLSEKRKTGQYTDADDGAGQTDRATKRTSVHLNIDAGAEGAVNRRTTSPLREGGALISGRTSEDDNPFGDQNRSSIGSFNDTSSIHDSEFSFRSSHTNVIPIAYIPPHSSSMSIADAQRGGFGESQAERPLPPRSAAVRASIPTSMASRDSLALAGAEVIELNPLPPVLTPDTPAVPHGTTANGAPIRPPRSPGLDLNLPKISSPLAGSSLVGSPDGQIRPSSYIASGNTSPTFLTPPSSATPRGMSVLAEQQSRARSQQSHLSTITTRSGTSTMSYILDPPQIITPVSGQGVRRVELHQGQAGLVKIGSAAAVPLPASPTSPTSSVNPFDDSNAAAARRHSRMSSQDTVRGGQGAGEDGFDSRSGTSMTNSSRWTASSLASEASEAVQFLQGQTVTFTNLNSPDPPVLLANRRLLNTASGASFDVPQSARSSEAFDTGSHVRPLLERSAWSSSTSAASTTGGTQSTAMSPSQSRDSTATATSGHISVLEGIPFIASPSPADDRMSTRGPSTSSVSLGLPVNVTAPLDGAGAPSPSLAAPTDSILPSSASSASITIAPPSPRPSIHSATDADDSDPLPAPFLPFAGQRPTSTASSTGGTRNGPNGERVQSSAISVRSGFGSGLSQIPFQLGFPSGFGEDGFSDAGGDDEDATRRSLLSARDSRFPPSEVGDVEPNAEEDEDASNPFGSHAEVDDSSADKAATADPRASMDSLALAVGLSANLDAQAGGQS